MARRTVEKTITQEGRDQGRTYRITEMPATQGELWAVRAINGLAISGVDIGSVASGMGMAGVAVLGIEALVKMPMDRAEPLLAEMFRCIEFVMPNGQTRPLLEDDIEEIATRVELRGEVLSLHLGFSLAAKIAELRSQLLMVAASTSKPETSPPTSDLSSPQDSPA